MTLQRTPNEACDTLEMDRSGFWTGNHADQGRSMSALGGHNGATDYQQHYTPFRSVDSKQVGPFDDPGQQRAMYNEMVVNEQKPMTHDPTYVMYQPSSRPGSAAWSNSMLWNGQPIPTQYNSDQRLVHQMAGKAAEQPEFDPGSPVVRTESKDIPRAAVAPMSKRSPPGSQTSSTLIRSRTLPYNQNRQGGSEKGSNGSGKDSKHSTTHRSSLGVTANGGQAYPPMYAMYPQLVPIDFGQEKGGGSMVRPVPMMMHNTSQYHTIRPNMEAKMASFDGSNIYQQDMAPQKSKQTNSKNLTVLEAKPSKDFSPNEVDQKVLVKDTQDSTDLIPLRSKVLEFAINCQLILGIGLLGLGVARIVLKSTFGFGIEIAYGLYVMVTAILGIAGVRRQQACNITACFVMSALSCVLWIGPFISGTLFTAEKTFPNIAILRVPSSQSNNSGLDIAVAVVSFLEVVFACVTTSIACLTIAHQWKKCMASQQYRGPENNTVATVKY